jgi:hypothetical protein
LFCCPFQLFVSIASELYYEFLPLCFSGAKILSALALDYTACGTYYQFCYVDASDCVQGRSKPFQLDFESDPSFGSPSFENFTLLGNNDDFVEVGEEEDGEIVIIKPRTLFLEEELCKLSSTVKDREVSYTVY